MLDTIIRNATIVDGTGAKAFRGDIGIEGARIEVIGDLSGATAGQTLDAAGRQVSPGFVDMHTHSDLSIMEDPRAQSKVRQGVTIELVGHCGFSPFPLKAKGATLFRPVTYGAHIPDVDWTDLAGYAARIDRQGASIHVAPLVGHVAVRGAVVGYDERYATAEEIEAMRRLVAEAMEQGAFGLSTGLTLPPSSYANHDEVVALAEVVGRYDGIYDTHARLWDGRHFLASEEAIDVGRRAHVRVQYAHIAIIDPRYQGKAAELAAIYEKANAEGVDAAFDVYPYVAAGTSLSQMLPGWVQAGGLPAMLARLRDAPTRQRVLEELDAGWFRGIPWAWDTFFVASPGDKGDRAWMGKHLAQLADEWRIAPKEAFVRIIDVSEDGARVSIFNRTEEDMQVFLRHRLSTVGSDGSAISADGPQRNVLVHPRYYGAHARVLGRYVREKKLLTLEEAVHKMTLRPALRLGLRRHGRLAPGYMADLVIFDAGVIADRATFEAPHQYAIGVQHVMVNGQWVVRDGEHTGARPAGVLRH
jgi:N-acyl-D-aspartate/D-glutamate deacylase